MTTRSRMRWFLASVAAVVVFGITPYVLVSLRTLNDQQEALEAARLRTAQFAADQADRVIADAFHEVELVADSLSDVGDVAGLDPAHLGGRLQRFSPFGSTILVVDESGAVVITADPSTDARWPTDGPAAAAVGHAHLAGGHSVSVPFPDPFSGRTMSALGVPLYTDEGRRVWTAIGLLDVSEPLIGEIVRAARRLGSTAHADLVDEAGIVVASSNPEHVLSTGDHPEWYRQMVRKRRAVAALVPHQSPTESTHLMGWAPMQQAPWAVAIGDDADQSLAVVHRGRRRLAAVTLAVLAATLAGIAISVQRLVSPSEDLLSPFGQRDRATRGADHEPTSSNADSEQSAGTSSSPLPPGPSIGAQAVAHPATAECRSVPTRTASHSTEPPRHTAPISTSHR